MEAFCNPDIVYSQLSDKIKEQKNFLFDVIEKHMFINKKRYFSDLDKEVRKYKLDVNI